MIAYQLEKPGPVETSPLRERQVSHRSPGRGELLLQVRSCGICHTDLHTIEGDLSPPIYPITPGHQVVGEVVQVGSRVEGWSKGDRAGVPWLHRACNDCAACHHGEENLCEEAVFTGFHVEGGFSEYILSDAKYTLPLPDELSDDEIAPLLCAGIIGYRSLHKADLIPGERLGLVGFGASAHLVIQVAKHWGCEVYVFTRSEGHRSLAHSLGASWVGGSEEDPPHPMDRAILFAPVGELVPKTLSKIRPGGTLAINAIHLSPIPQMDYSLLYGERTLRSVANATFQDGVDSFKLAVEIPISPKVTIYPMGKVNEALADLKHSRINGAGVLKP